ncbi:hypothetical protein OE810_03305 [Rhodobacteraceae bacterium XHP0102]|nr:hypothetical protein [Rhodobacteraceae bacterium XHP0102]
MAVSLMAQNDQHQPGPWGQDVSLLVMTYSKMEKYLPAIRQNLDLFWPNRPDMLIATDGQAEGEDVFVGTSASFLGLLSEALHELRLRFPKVQYVFLLLEDLCPLAPVDDARLSEAFRILKGAGGQYMLNHWPTKRHRPWDDENWDISQSLSEGRTRLMPMSRRYETYNSLVACIWRMDYLEQLIDAKLARGIADPWGFERYLDGVQEQHYLLENAWPTFANGFMIAGSVNARCVTEPALPASPLMSQLRREYCGADSFLQACLKRFNDRMARSWHKRFVPKNRV